MGKAVFQGYLPGGMVAAALLLAPALASDSGTRHDPARLDVRQTCELIGNKLSSIGVDECLSLGLVESGVYSALGRALMFREYPPLGSRRPNARVLLIGGTHGDEYASFSVTMKWMKILNIHHSGLFHWHVVPALNLDGLLESPATRVNHNGVDLNRNMSVVGLHPQVALLYWQQHNDCNPRRYPGPYPLSENETRWLTREISSFEPDAIVSVHAPYNLIDYDGPDDIMPPDNLGQIRFRKLGNFPGSLGRYAGEHLGIPVLTVELASSRYMPSDVELRRVWVDLVRWLRLNIRSRGK